MLYIFLAEYALAASAFFIDKNAEKENFSRLKNRLKYGYKPYTDKGNKTQKERNLKDCVSKVLQDLKEQKNSLLKPPKCCLNLPIYLCD